jgi:hypothetical protein
VRLLFDDRMKSVCILLVALVLGCTPPDSQSEITYEKNGPLKHVVLLDLKEGCSEADVDRVVQALYSLQEIEEVIDLEVSRYIDTGDDRSLGGFDILLYTEFGDEADLQKYAEDEFHLFVREELIPYMAAKPRVLDSFEF